MEIVGSVQIFADGTATLQLRPAAAPAPAPAPPPPVVQAALEPVPGTDYIMGLLQSGALLIHPTKASVQRNDIRVAVSNVQRQLHLAPGLLGGWTPEAWDRLKNWLLAAKRQRLGKAPDPDQLETLPRPAVPGLATPFSRARHG